MPTPITSVPQDYREVMYLNVLEDQQALVVLNVLSIGGFVVGIGLMAAWTAVVTAARGTYTALLPVPDIALWIAVIAVFPLHEWVHGQVIRWVGHRPRYGMKLVDVGPIKVPIALYATTNDGLFRRGEFIAVAMAPLVVITFAGMLLVVLLPDVYTVFIAFAVILNMSGAVGDIWMTWLVLKYSPDALVRDEADAIRIYDYVAPSESKREIT